MVSIYFQSREEADFVYQLLLQADRSGILNIKKEEQGITVQSKEGKSESVLLLMEPLKALITQKKRNEWLREILEEQFFYQDSYEQSQIIEIIHSIIDGKRKGLPLPEDVIQCEERIMDALGEVILGKGFFSLEAFLTFRLRPYYESLENLVEIAIDEYKLEQEYQMFIHYLRDFISDRSHQKRCVYIVHDGNEFLFFDEKQREIKRSELNKMIDRKLLSDHPIYVDSNIIAPLISINPEKIFLFTDDPEQGIVQTLCQVFDESLIVQPSDWFGQGKKYE